MTLLLIIKKSLDRCQSRKASPFHIHQKDHRRIRKIRHLPGTGALQDTAKSIVKAHDALQYSDSAFREFLHFEDFPAEQISQRIPVRKKAVQISRRDLQHRPVKHRIDIIRPALKRANLLNFLLQKRKQRTGKQRLPPTALLRGNHDPGKADGNCLRILNQTLHPLLIHISSSFIIIKFR